MLVEINTLTKLNSVAQIKNQPIPCIISCIIKGSLERMQGNPSINLVSVLQFTLDIC